MATGRTGTLSLADLLVQQYTSAEAFGIDTIAQVIQNDIAAHNAIVADMVDSFMERTTDAQRISGASNAGSMMAVNEMGRAPTQKAAPGATVGFPLEKYQYNLGWNREYFRRATPRDMAIQTLNAEKAHLLVIEREVKKAMYLSANYTYVDNYNRGISLTVRRFTNADSQPIGDGPNGEIFTASTHQHYVANATLTAATVTTLINNVLEHAISDRIVVAFSATDEAAVRALSGFNAAIEPQVTVNMNTTQVREPLDITRLNNRFIGRFSGAEVWIKPWAIANYALAYDAGNADRRPLVIREYAPGESALRIVAEFDSYPLHAQFSEAEFGIGVWNRTAGAVLYFASGTFADPTIT